MANLYIYLDSRAFGPGLRAVSGPSAPCQARPGVSEDYGATRRPASRATVLISSEGSTGLARWVW
jgi:hypothetical protein